MLKIDNRHRCTIEYQCNPVLDIGQWMDKTGQTGGLTHHRTPDISGQLLVKHSQVEITTLFYLSVLKYWTPDWPLII